MSARFESSTCRHCLGAGCLHCNNRGQFFRRLHRRDPEAAALRRKLLELPPQNIVRLQQPQEAA